MAKRWAVQGSNLDRGKTFDSSLKLQTRSGAHQVSYSVGTGRYFPSLKRPELEVDHSRPSNAEIMNKWSCTSTPPVCLHVVCMEYVIFINCSWVYTRWQRSVK